MFIAATNIFIAAVLKFRSSSLIWKEIEKKKIAAVLIWIEMIYSLKTPFYISGLEQQIKKAVPDMNKASDNV